MELKAELITRIDEFGGLEKIIKNLKKHEKSAPWNRRIVFSGTTLFLKQLYRGNINLEWCALGHRKLANFVIRYKNQCVTLFSVAPFMKVADNKIGQFSMTKRTPFKVDIAPV